MKKGILIAGFYLCATIAFFGQEPLQCQDVTIALDENGEATITSSDVLVNTSGTILAPDIEAFFIGEYAYDSNSNTLDFIENSNTICDAFTFYGFDQNSISDKRYISGEFFDLPPFLSPIEEQNNFCDWSDGFFGITNGDFVFNLKEFSEACLVG